MVCMYTHDEDVLNAKTVFFVHAVITILPASFLDILKRMRVGVGFNSINIQYKWWNTSFRSVSITLIYDGMKCLMQLSKMSNSIYSFEILNFTLIRNFLDI